MQITTTCYLIYGLSTIPPWMVSAGFIIGSEKTLVVDCGGNYLSAKTIYGYAKNVKPGNELIAINTEPHFDHMGGNCFFREMGVDIYGHADINRNDDELKGTIKEYSESITSKVRRDEGEEDLVFYKTTVENPNKKITSDFSMDLGGMEVEILLTPGHTKKNLSVYVPSDKTLYCGDTIVTGYIPNLEDGGVEDWKQWLLSIDKIMSKSPEIIAPAHGEILAGDEIEKEIARMKRIITESIRRGKAPTQL